MKFLNFSYLDEDEEFDIDSNSDLIDAFQKRKQSCLKITVRFNKDLLYASSVFKEEAHDEDKPSWM